MTKKPKIRLRKHARKILEKSLPRKIRHKLLRRFIELDYNPSPRLRVKLATTEAELEAAFALLHDAYVASNFMDPQPSGLRVTKFHALPATTTIVALWDDKVVGTMSLVRRSAFGMPLESIFDISHLVQNGQRVFETSSLAVHKDFSGRHGMILFPLLKFMVEYALGYFGSNYMAIAVNPTWIEFYDALFNFTRLSKTTIDHYDFVKGAPAIGAFISVDTLKEDLAKIYKGAPKHRCFYTYFFKHKLPNIELPERPFTKISDPVLTPEILDSFFNRKTQTFSEMSEKELFVLRQLYRASAFHAVLPRLRSQENGFHLRHESRIEVSLPAEIKVSGHSSIPVTITDLGKNGLGLAIDRALRLGEVYSLKTCVDEIEHHLQVAMQWVSPCGQKSGFRVVHASDEWRDFAGLLKADLLRQIS